MSSFLQPVRLPLIVRMFQRLALARKLGIGERLFSGALKRLGVCWVRAACGVTWKLDLRNPTHRWIVYGDYEDPLFLRWVRRHIRREWVIIDSGANIGQMTLYFAPHLTKGRIFAFEPGDAAARWLLECVSHYPEWRVEVVHAALGARAGEVRLKEGGTEELVGSWNKISEAEGYPVAMTSLDEFADRRGLKQVDLWKLDVEGYELEALAGASRVFLEGRIGAVYVELWDRSRDEIVQFLGGCGLVPEILDLSAAECGGALFVRRRR
jgi:FkbM family methyltransferase